MCVCVFTHKSSYETLALLTGEFAHMNLGYHCGVQISHFYWVDIAVKTAVKGFAFCSMCVYDLFVYAYMCVY